MNVSAVVPGLKTHGGNPSFNKLFLLINLNKGWFPKSQEVTREASKTAQTCEQSANSVVEDADLHHLMLSGGITKILPVKKSQQESLWSRKQPHETCKNNQSLFISDWTLYWAELTDAGLHSWNCGLNRTQTGYLMTGALLTMSTVQTEAQGMVQASTDCGGVSSTTEAEEVCQVGRNGNTWSWLRESGPEFRSCGLLKSQLKRFQLEDMQELWDAVFWYRLSKEETVATNSTTALDHNTEKGEPSQPGSLRLRELRAAVIDSCSGSSHLCLKSCADDTVLDCRSNR